MKPTRPYITVANVLTTINLFCGFLAVTMVVSGNYVAAAWIILLAGVFDALDGPIARAAGQDSDFGLQMDSLSDVVSAGIAPSLLIYEYALKYISARMAVGLMVGFLPLFFAAFRLARYNVMTQREGHKTYYTGLPAPMAAASLASLVILHHNVGWPFLLRFMVIMTIAVSLAMGSHLKYEGFPRFSVKTGGGNRFKLIIFFCALLSLFIFPEITPFIFMMLYFLSGLVKFFYNLFAERGVADELLEPEELIVDQQLQ
ncbi:CDP-diacylglycerol--serine O-phosphatidyltransferase [candidate division KSB1 bacterium]|nr:CDP-diacylglycerol--serine O-phosphatidyltransferase [candidate division KSB1 bacterium]